MTIKEKLRKKNPGFGFNALLNLITYDRKILHFIITDRS